MKYYDMDKYPPELIPSINEPFERVLKNLHLALKCLQYYANENGENSYAYKTVMEIKANSETGLEPEKAEK